MNRKPEPELMEEAEQARAYAAADFEEPHSRVVSLFIEKFGTDHQGRLLDLGCGPGDITFRFARQLPDIHCIGLDGSEAMLAPARQELRLNRQLAEKVQFIHGVLPGADIPEGPYRIITSSSFLHHLHDPQVLWQTVRRFATPGTIIYVVDLFRPENRQQAAALVQTYAAAEPEILKKDFFNSLLAAFTPEEIRQQLQEAGLDELRVEQTSDRHLMIYGIKR